MIKIISVFIVVALIVYGIIEGIRAMDKKERSRAFKYALYAFTVASITTIILALAVVFF